MTTISHLLDAIQNAYKEQLPFVAFQEPNTSLVTAYFQKDAQLHTVTDYSEQGFVFAPFDLKSPAVLIPVDKELKAEQSLQIDVAITRNFYEEDAQAKAGHIEFVEKAKDFLEKEAVSKVVIARKKDIHYKAFDLRMAFEKLLTQYPLATTYVWFHPKVGLWMGATPEILLKVHDQQFTTMSLAGTQVYNGTEDVVWKPKEIEEQQLVTDYVLNKLRKHTNALEHSKVYTVKAGSLLHLRTDIQGELSDAKGVAELLRVVHPTPAVCGFPTETAKAFILANEDFNRSYYTGFLGTLNVNQKTSLYVNLRCMQVLPEQVIRLYIGGGITLKSDPLQEWEETVSKCKTMEQVLF